LGANYDSALFQVRDTRMHRYQPADPGDPGTIRFDHLDRIDRLIVWLRALTRLGLLVEAIGHPCGISVARSMRDEFARAQDTGRSMPEVQQQAALALDGDEQSAANGGYAQR
jgi:hypothetical protein